MGKNASGMYVIDEDYKIISYNLAAREIYPQLKRGEKCYHCLRNRETPCEICPVVNGIKGPKNYLEPGRNILRSVDAVEIHLCQELPEQQQHGFFRRTTEHEAALTFRCVLTDLAAS